MILCGLATWERRLERNLAAPHRYRAVRRPLTLWGGMAHLASAPLEPSHTRRGVGLREAGRWPPAPAPPRRRAPAPL